jgi:hypothetical protein
MHLNLKHKDNTLWAELIDECWNAWTNEELEGKWAALKVKANVGMGATHHGECKVYLFISNVLMIT